MLSVRTLKRSSKLKAQLRVKAPSLATNSYRRIHYLKVKPAIVDSSVGLHV